ncbi:MAG: serine/threonine-protein kinase, partial [Verrucomicrobiota bacterium]
MAKEEEKEPDGKDPEETDSSEKDPEPFDEDMDRPAFSEESPATGSDPNAYDPYETIGKGFQIDEFTIFDTLGHGSMATVYHATDETGHEVALKIFQEGPSVSKTMLERFHREAEASKKLRKHPNIITIYSSGRESPYHYIAMESVPGRRTLEDVIEDRSLTIRQIVTLTIKIARALQYAHARRVVHRDVKPTNIMVDEFGEPLLTDFGVAELFDWPSCTVTGALTGTPLYMSPEQANGDETGPASDIYSLGVVLYEALTGVLPYDS